jgi:5-methylcytosine-specific restriction endonuclease McrA
MKKDKTHFRQMELSCLYCGKKVTLEMDDEKLIEKRKERWEKEHRRCEVKQ